MTTQRKVTNLHQVLGWILILALSVQVMSRLAFHLHHVDSNEHTHIIDVHLVSDSHANNHLSHESTHEIKIAPDVIVKKNHDNGTVFTLSVFLFILFPITLTIINRRWSLSRNIHRFIFYYGLSPPLRAPPIA